MRSVGKRSGMRDRNRGLAIVAVLSIISLTMVMVLSVLTEARSELKQSAVGLDSVRATQFRDLAVNLVMGQIRHGTEMQDGGGWASQPGAIRRFNAAGDPGTVFKLYSNSQMIGDYTSITSDMSDLGSWQTYPSRFVDMNEPVMAEVPNPDPDDSTRLFETHFPIIDPRALDVEGFNYEVDQIPGAISPGRALDNPNARLPMPVEWLYVLQDGTVGTLNADNKFVGPKTPTRENPIVGRVAFWTDDETCKVNLNTASEGTHWSVPKNASFQDIQYARYQPAQNEFQRYPGHPATTSLSPLLYPGNDFTPDMNESLYNIIPRVPNGGSVSGTVVTSNNNGPLSTFNTRLPLFASKDELMLDLEREQNSLSVGNGSDGMELLSNTSLRRLDAFLTAHSRAPELNLFGLPRVSIWPVNHNASSSPRKYRTAFDELIAFCSQLGPQLGRAPKPLYTFQRREADSSTEDYQMITRNQQLYNYLLEMTKRDIPGFGGSTFASKYGADHPQIMTQIFDYIRCVNLHDDNHPAVGGTSHTTFTNYRDDTGTRATVGHGQVVPIKIGDTRGFGRFNSLSEIGFVVICCGDEEYETSPQDFNGETLDTGEIAIQPMLLIEPFSVAHGWTQLSDHMRYRITGLESFQIEGQPMFDGNGRTKVFRDEFWGGFHSQRTWGGTNGFRNASFRELIGKKIIVSKNGSMSFSGGKLTLEIASMETATPEIVQTIELNFPPADLPKPKLVTAETPGGQVTQGGIGSGRTTESHWWTMENRQGARHSSPFYPWNEQNNPDKRPGEEWGPRAGAVIFSDEHDVVRSLVPPHGDYRLIAARETIDDTVFQPMPGYSSSSQMHAHIFHHNPAGSHWTDGYGATDVSKQLVPGANYHHGKLPDFPPGARQTTGDFDNGIAFVQDGAYINKPDEGNNHRGHYRGRDGGVAAPYFDQNWVQRRGGRTYFSPNRLICSPVFFGSLPTGVMRNIPWQTLLFRPQNGHPGEQGVPDYALLDLFWMPVVDPWAISEPSSTAGKVNLNHQIVPFTYIERSTALRAVFKSTDITAVPKTAGDYYKIYDHEMADYYVPPVPPRAETYNKDIDADETLRQFAERFATGRVFRTGAEICDVHLVPEGATLESMRSGSFWSTHALTGDNVRERPYSYIHPRVTARSNTFRVHIRTQMITKARSSEPDEFDPEKDTLSSEFRGSTLIERYLSPDDEEIGDYAANPAPFLDGTATGSKKRPDELYVFRVVNQRRFAPK